MRVGPLSNALGCIAALALLACSDPAAELHGHLETGQTALASRQPGEAVRAFKSALQIDPNSIEAHYGLAQAFLAGRRGRQAVWEFEETVRLEPDHYPSRIQLARLLRFGGPEDLEAAVAHAQHVIDAESLSEDDPTRWVAWLAKGGVLETLDRDEEARTAYETAAGLAPAEGAPPFVLGRFLQKRGERAGAETQFRKLAELEPGFDSTLVLARFFARDRARDADAEALYREALKLATPAQQVPGAQALAGFLYARGRLDEAVKVLEAGLESRPDDPDLVASLAGLHHANGDLERAEATLAQAVERAAEGDPQPALRLADFRHARGDLEGALEAAEAAVAAGGEDQARLRKAELLIQSGLFAGDVARVAQGKAVVDAELAKDDGHPEARVVRGKLDLIEGRAEDAAASARRALDRRPDWSRAHVLLGRALAAQGDLAGARDELERAYGLEPSRIETQRLLADLLLPLGEPEAALEHGRSVLRANPDDHALRLRVAQALRVLGRGDEALEEVERIPESDRGPEILYALGQLYAVEGDLAGARHTLEKGLALDPHRPEILRVLFEIDQRTGRVPESLGRVTAALAVRPGDPRLHRLAGRAYMALGRSRDAEHSLRRAIELGPNDLASYGVLAQLMAESGRPEEIVRSYEQAVAANPELGVLRLTLARLHEGMGREDDALAGYEQALRLDPSLAAAKNNLAWLLAERGTDLDRALDLAQEAKAALPEQADTADTLGWVLYKKGIASAAIGYLQEAERLLPAGHPQLRLVRLHLALAHEANGELDKARSVADRALLDAPAGPVTSELRALRDKLPGPAAEAS